MPKGLTLVRLSRLNPVHARPSLARRIPGILPWTSRSPSMRRWATSTTPHSTASDPSEVEALNCLEQGTQKLEEGDVEAAKALYQRSVDIKRTASSLFNLGVTHYHLTAWKESIALQPSSPDAHTSSSPLHPLGFPPIMIHPLPRLSERPPLADNTHPSESIAASLSPEDPEIAFNLAAVLEACGRLEEALEQYKRSKQFGVERAAMHIRNVSAKILGKKMSEVEAAQRTKP
ncbi:hypothetical protein NLI96_g1986 [Meripilus lineatus]|uniref:TPR-like protein n=1 Tax=Meripilus lineatus TaxID=2056292 RepID=A0AAD5YHU7_9APHY|nr:hypothetical protein NLI96_g1986 [Physisporinus lineatus]